MFNKLNEQQQKRFERLLDENIYCLANELIWKAIHNQLNEGLSSGEECVLDELSMYVHDNDMEGYDVSQWYIVSKWFSDRLVDAGAFSAEIYGVYVWARFAGNQHIKYDHDPLKAMADIIECEDFFTDNDEDDDEDDDDTND